jgi:hypothetical protein
MTYNNPPATPGYAVSNAPAYAPPPAAYSAVPAAAPLPQGPQPAYAPAAVPAAFDDAKVVGGMDERLGPGLHKVAIQRIKTHVSRKGPVFFILEMEMLESGDLPGDPSHTVHRAGEKVSTSYNLNGDYAGEVKAVLAQLMGGNPADVKAHHVQWAADVSNPFAGTVVEIASRTRLDPKTGMVRCDKNGSPYVNHKFRVLQPGPAIAALASK